MDAEFHVNKNSKIVTIRPKPATTVRKEFQHYKSKRTSHCLIREIFLCLYTNNIRINSIRITASFCLASYGIREKRQIKKELLAMKSPAVIFEEKSKGMIKII